MRHTYIYIQMCIIKWRTIPWHYAPRNSIIDRPPCIFNKLVPFELSCTMVVQRNSTVWISNVVFCHCLPFLRWVVLAKKWSVATIIVGKIPHPRSCLNTTLMVQTAFKKSDSLKKFSKLFNNFRERKKNHSNIILSFKLKIC